MTEAVSAPGRPINEKASAALKDAALKLVREKGYTAVSISELVKMAGVSRQTLYNRWKTKAELVLDAFFDESTERVEAPDLSSNVCRRDLLAKYLRRIFYLLEQDGDGLRNLISAAQSDSDFRDVFRERFSAPRARIVTMLLQNAQMRGELDGARDVELLSSFIHGVFGIIYSAVFPCP